MAKITVNGRQFWQAVGYAAEVCPPSGESGRLSHVVMIDRRVIGSDGKRWHVGFLPEDAEVNRPLVIMRESILELIKRIEFADWMARRHGGAFLVHINDETGRADLQFADEEMSQKLLEAKVGHVPTKWRPPVPDDTPELASSAVESGHNIDAAKWWQSWEKDHGTVTPHGFGPGKPVRFDVHHRGELVGQAYVLPSSRGAAQLPHNEPLLEGITPAEQHGQSILDLSLELLPPRPGALPATSEPRTPGGKKAKGTKPKLAAVPDADEDGELEPPKAKPAKKGKKKA